MRVVFALTDRLQTTKSACWSRSSFTAKSAVRPRQSGQDSNYAPHLR
jgi:hypothetical protein